MRVGRSREAFFVNIAGLLHCSFQTYAFQDGAEKFLNALCQSIRLNQSEAANLSILLPTDKGQLVPCAYIGLVAQFLWQHHLSPLIHRDERLNLAAILFALRGTAGFISLFPGHRRVPFSL